MGVYYNRAKRVLLYCKTCKGSFFSTRKDALFHNVACRKYWQRHKKPYPTHKQRLIADGPPPALQQSSPSLPGFEEFLEESNGNAVVLTAEAISLEPLQPVITLPTMMPAEVTLPDSKADVQPKKRMKKVKKVKKSKPRKQSGHTSRQRKSLKAKAKKKPTTPTRKK